MTYEELVQEAKKIYEPADASSITGHVAYQFNIEGEAAGAFYLEVSEGKVHVEPYEYFDRDVLFTTTVDTLIKIGTGKMDPVFAYTTGKLKVQGSLDKALLLKKISGASGEEGKEPEAVKEIDEKHAEAVKTQKAESVAEEQKPEEAVTETAPEEAEESKDTEASASQEVSKEASAAKDAANKWPNRKKKRK